MSIKDAALLACILLIAAMLVAHLIWHDITGRHQ